MLHKKVIKKIDFEVKEIDTLFETYSSLLQKVKTQTPDAVEMAAISSIIHSFYNGLENIFMVIAKEVDEDFPSGEFWHTKLLKQMTEANNYRKAVLSEELLTDLREYLGFRHFHRHSYSFHLDWNELEKLSNAVNEKWKEIKNNLIEFIDSLNPDEKKDS